MTATIDGTKVYQKQDIGDIDTELLKRKAAIIKANDKYKPVVTGKPVVEDKKAVLDAAIAKAVAKPQGDIKK